MYTGNTYALVIHMHTRYIHACNTDTHAIRTWRKYGHAHNTYMHALRTCTQYRYACKMYTQAIWTRTQYVHARNTDTHAIRTRSQYGHTRNTDTHAIRTLRIKVCILFFTGRSMERHWLHAQAERFHIRHGEVRRPAGVREQSAQWGDALYDYNWWVHF